MTLNEAGIKIIDKIKDIYDPDEAKVLAQLTVSYICHISRTQLLAEKQKQLTLRQEASINLVLDELITGKPLQYILGETEFYGLRLKVTPAVLIPRPETEELVDWVLKEAESGELRRRHEKEERGKGGENILDIGTGSGGIAIALKKHLPIAEVSALDISIEALEIARYNAVLNKTRVNFFLQDILHPASGSVLTIHNPILTAQYSQPNTQYSIIVSNPPYITHSEKEEMHKNVLEHEPHTALFVPDHDPLLFYRAVAGFAQDHLTESGLLFLEINETLADETVSVLIDKGFKNIELRKDIRGKDRMIKAMTA